MKDVHNEPDSKTPININHFVELYRIMLNKSKEDNAIDYIKLIK